MSLYYLAGASAEIDRCEEMHKALSTLGHECTYNWCEEIRSRAARGLTDAHLTHEERVRFVQLDLLAIERAQLFIFLVPREARTSGAWCELQYAHDLKYLTRSKFTKRIIVIADKTTLAKPSNMFAVLGEEFYAHEAEALVQIGKAT